MPIVGEISDKLYVHLTPNGSYLRAGYIARPTMDRWLYDEVPAFEFSPMRRSYALFAEAVANFPRVVRRYQARMAFYQLRNEVPRAYRRQDP